MVRSFSCNHTCRYIVLSIIFSFRLHINSRFTYGYLFIDVLVLIIILFYNMKALSVLALAEIFLVIVAYEKIL